MRDGCGFECCLHLLRADRWPQLSSRLLDPGCLSKFMNSSISYTHSDFLLELSEFPSSKNSQVPETLEFQKLSSSKSCRVPKTLKFQKLSSSKNSRVPKVVEFQKLSSTETLEFQKLSSSKSCQVPKLSSSRNSRVPKAIGFHPSELEFQITLSSNELSSIIQNFSSNLLLCCIHLSSIFRTRVPKYFTSYTHFLGSTTIQVPRNSTEFRHLITK